MLEITKLKISLIVPIYNEAAHLERFLEKLDALSIGLEKELVLIDDCSKDGSREILRNFSFKSAAQKLFQEKNQGKGAALRRGIEAAQGDFIVIQDADFEYDMDDLADLVLPLLEDRADVVYGSRFNRAGTQVHRTFHYLVNSFLTLLSDLCSGLYLSDMETCYKVFRGEILKGMILESNRFGFEPEVTAKVAKLRVRVHELPIKYFPRNYFQGKKISWKDGIAAIWHIIKFNFLRNSQSSFKESMPERYLVRGMQLL